MSFGIPAGVRPPSEMGSWSSIRETGPMGTTGWWLYEDLEEIVPRAAVLMTEAHKIPGMVYTYWRSPVGFTYNPQEVLDWLKGPVSPEEEAAREAEIIERVKEQMRKHGMEPYES